MSTLYQIAACVGYVAGMTWATALAPPGAGWPAVFMLHGAFALGYLVGTHPSPRRSGADPVADL